MKQFDTYVYPGTEVLINKFDCRDPNELKKLEALSTGGNLAFLQLNPVRGRFDFQHLKDIHFFIFQDIYEWAGKIRTVDIGKGNLFCRVQFIEEYAKTVFSDFHSACHESCTDKDKFITVLAAHYADLNALHPFREGNGRSQREFIRELCLDCEYVLDLTKTTHEEMLSASVVSFNTGDSSGFREIFSRSVIPIDEYKNLQDHLQSKLLILSKDDLV